MSKSMSKPKQLFTQYLGFDEHIQWVTEESEETNTTTQSKRGCNGIIILGFLAILIGILLFIIEHELLGMIFIFGTGLPLLTVVGITGITRHQIQSFEYYGITNKRVLKLKSGHFSSLSLTDLSAVRIRYDNTFYYIEIVPHSGGILLIRELDAYKAERITDLLKEFTSITIPPLPEN